MRSQDYDLSRMPLQINKVVFWKFQGLRGIVPHGRQYHFLEPARALPKHMKPPVTKENAIVFYYFSICQILIPARITGDISMRGMEYSRPSEK